MTLVVKPFPVLYACQGCAQFGQFARDVGALLDRAGVAETVWLGAGADLKPKSRYPIVALDGCDKACAQSWLRQHGSKADRSYVLLADSPSRAAQRIAADMAAR